MKLFFHSFLNCFEVQVVSKFRSGIFVEIWVKSVLKFPRSFFKLLRSVAEAVFPVVFKLFRSLGCFEVSKKSASKKVTKQRGVIETQVRESRAGVSFETFEHRDENEKENRFYAAVCARP